MKKLLLPLISLLLIIFIWAVPHLLKSQKIPGLTGNDRVLLRIWTVNSPGSGQTWLKKQLHAFERANPGISTYLRSVTAEELVNPDAILPDVILYMPGDVLHPDELFLPLSGAMPARDGLMREELLRAGRWQNQQYGLPLCWGGWILAIDGAFEPSAACTPAPTTLLGRPAATSEEQAATEPPYPLEAVLEAASALQAPQGAALFTLPLLLEQLPPLPKDFASLTSNEVYAAFQQRLCASALLTTGQATAFSSLTAGGGGFSHRIITPKEIITDQVYLASVTKGAEPTAALLLSFLTSADAQQALFSQGLHTARNDLMLYPAGMPAKVEQASHCSLAAINAFIPASEVHTAAWTYFQGSITLDEALLPLM